MKLGSGPTHSPFPQGSRDQLWFRLRTGASTMTRHPVAENGTLGRDVAKGFRTLYGASGLDLFQRNGKVSVTTALDLVRGFSRDAIDVQSSIYWDDANAIAQIPQDPSSTASLTSSTQTPVPHRRSRRRQVTASISSNLTRLVTTAETMVRGHSRWLSAC